MAVKPFLSVQESMFVACEVRSIREAKEPLSQDRREESEHKEASCTLWVVFSTKCLLKVRCLLMNLRPRSTVQQESRDRCHNAPEPYCLNPKPPNP